MNTSVQSPSERKYGRDFLLQLRLHPVSLKKPKNLKNLEVVKNRLYLQQMNNCPGAQKECPASTEVHGSSKYNSDSTFRYQRALPEYFPRSYPLYGSTLRQCNSASQLGSHSKHRSIFYPDNANISRKLSIQCPSDYKVDLLTDEMFSSHTSSPLIPWSKHYTYDDIFNYHSRTSTPNSDFKPSSDTGKNKKNPLPIINPLNGKNVLEDSLTSEGESKLDEDLSSKVNEGPSKVIGDCPESKELERIDQSLAIESETLNEDAFSNEVFVESFTDSEALKENETFLHSDEDKLNIDNEENSIGIPMENDAEKESMQSNEENLNFNNFAENEFTPENNLLTYANIPSDPSSSNYEKPVQLSVDENTRKLEDQLKASLALLKEKSYAMRQEQQKMAIVQSFLRFKKHQLDENFKSLDDKKIEIANWECNIASKEKKLMEKECWLEGKRQVLKNREEKLQEKERSFMMSQLPSEAVVEKCYAGDFFPKQTGKSTSGGDVKKSTSVEDVSKVEEITTPRDAGYEGMYHRDRLVRNSASKKEGVYKNISLDKVWLGKE